MIPWLAEIAARVERATKGPWKVCPDENAPEGMPLVCLGPPGEHGGPVCSQPLTEEDAVFIAHARTDIPRLVEAVALLEAALEAIEFPSFQSSMVRILEEKVQMARAALARVAAMGEREG